MPCYIIAEDATTATSFLSCYIFVNIHRAITCNTFISSLQAEICSYYCSSGSVCALHINIVSTKGLSTLHADQTGFVSHLLRFGEKRTECALTRVHACNTNPHLANA